MYFLPSLVSFSCPLAKRGSSLSSPPTHISELSRRAFTNANMCWTFSEHALFHSFHSYPCVSFQIWHEMVDCPPTTTNIPRHPTMDGTTVCQSVRYVEIPSISLIVCIFYLKFIAISVCDSVSAHTLYASDTSEDTLTFSPYGYLEACFAPTSWLFFVLSWAIKLC